MNDIIKSRVASADRDVASYSASMDAKAIGFDRDDSWVARFGRVVRSILDDRARSVDFVCLLILIEVLAGKLWITPFIYWVYVAKYILIFSGGAYLVYFKKLPTQVKHTVMGVLQHNR